MKDNSKATKKEDKKISDMSEKEILRQQLELLAERTKQIYAPIELALISKTMLDIVFYLSSNETSVL